MRNKNYFEEAIIHALLDARRNGMTIATKEHGGGAYTRTQACEKLCANPAVVVEH